MARLGLRAPEVIAIQLDDIDWRAGELLVRGKGQRHDRLPIPPDVGEAIIRYLQEERTSTTTRTLFVTHRAPNRPFKNSQVINAILKEAFSATGVKPPTPYVGTHVLRHCLFAPAPRWKRSAICCGIGRGRDDDLREARHRWLRSIAQPWPVAEVAR
jgi:integrase/recombinase XerD